MSVYAVAYPDADGGCLVADTTDELAAFTAALDVPDGSFDEAGTPFERFHLSGREMTHATRRGARMLLDPDPLMRLVVRKALRDRTGRGEVTAGILEQLTPLADDLASDTDQLTTLAHAALTNYGLPVTRPRGDDGPDLLVADEVGVGIAAGRGLSATAKRLARHSRGLTELVLVSTHVSYPR